MSGSTNLLEPGDPVLEVDVSVTGACQVRRRMTLTYPVLNRSRHVFGVVTRREKVAMQRLLAGDTSIPAERVCQDQSLLFVDAAAGQLTARHKEGG